MKKKTKKVKKAKVSKALVVRSKQVVAKTIQRDNTTLPISFQDGVRLLPVEQQILVLEEYDIRRKSFFKWLFSHLIEGIHYGIPPGCEATYNENGDMVDYKGNRVPPSQWREKSTLFKSGAFLLIDLMQIQTTYETDKETWLMMGSPAGTVVRKCTMFFRNQRLGEGTGAYDLAMAKTRRQDANMTVKMADKRAAVACLLNSVPLLGELFTQDTEEKTAERRKGNLKSRRLALVVRVENLLLESRSKWTGEPPVETWLNQAVQNLFGPAARLTSLGAIDQFEKALDEKKFDMNTAAVIGNS